MTNWLAGLSTGEVITLGAFLWSILSAAAFWVLGGMFASKKDVAQLSEKVDRVDDDVVRIKAKMEQIPTKDDFIEIKADLAKLSGGTEEINKNVRLLLAQQLDRNND